MLNTQKLLYVLPDLAYVAELLPDKKPYTFAIQSFKQINGEFLNETEFKAENIVKLINKLDEGEEYFLVLPDFLFTNTIISVQETSDAKIKEKLSSETLPKLGLKDETHLIETVVLNQLKGTTRVQLSAIEKSILSVFKVAIAEKNIKITGIAPLSWTVKSLVSLEPSISVLQMGTRLYTAQHYIGVDQTTTATIDQPENIVETIKTLKGAEPNIQTVYLCSNAIVENKLKDELSKILPIQQMSSKDGSDKIPSYISEIVIASQRTLAIPDFSVPTFKLAKPTAEEKEKYASILTAAGSTAVEADDDEVAVEIPKPNISPVPESEGTPPKEPEETAVPEEEKALESEEKLPDIEHAVDVESVKEEKSEVVLPDIEDAEKEETKPAEMSTPPSILPSAASIAAGAGVVAAGTAPIEVAASIKPPVIVDDSMTNDTLAEAAKSAEDEKESEPAQPDTETTEPIATPKAAPPTESSASTLESSSSITPPVVVGVSQIDTPNVDSPVASEADQDIDLKQFAQNGETAVESSNTTKPIIKNKSGAKNMMKMILITTGVFILTVAVGIGVGLAILKYSGNGENTAPPVVEVEEPTPTPSATPTPTPDASASAQVDKAKVSILVVNATTKAGYAGQIQTKLEDDDFEKVDTGNAKGDYEDEGDLVYMKEENASLLKALEEASGLKLTATDSAKVEDTPGKYDAVIVLAQ